MQDVVYDKPKTLDSTFDAGGDTASTLIAVSNMCEFINIQTILGKYNASKRDKLFIDYITIQTIYIYYIPLWVNATLGKEINYIFFGSRQFDNDAPVRDLGEFLVHKNKS